MFKSVKFPILLLIMAAVSFSFLMPGCSKSKSASSYDEESLPVLGEKHVEYTEIKEMNDLKLPKDTWVKLYQKDPMPCSPKPMKGHWFCKVRVGIPVGIEVHKEYWPQVDALKDTGQPFMIYGRYERAPAPNITVQHP
jgi:hypothetical protein